MDLNDKKDDNKEYKDEASGDEKESGDALVDGKKGSGPGQEVGKDPRIAELEEKVKALESQIAEKDKRIKELEDSLKWKQADFENYRKSVERRMVSEKLQMEGAILKDFLSFFDAFDKAMETKNELLEKEGETVPEKIKKFLGGLDGLYKNLQAILDSKELKRIDALGKPFDYNYHEVMMQVEDESVDEDTVVKVVQNGWLLHGKVLRPAMVAVSKHPPPEKPEPSESGDEEGADDQGEKVAGEAGENASQEG